VKQIAVRHQIARGSRARRDGNNFSKAAALLQSLARNHAFVDGNRRKAWAAAWTFLHINGIQLGDFDVDDAEVFINDVATGGDLAIDAIAAKLAGYARSQRK
jgi:death on curing protein